MKKVYILLVASLFFAVACDNDLEQFPPNIATADSLEDFAGVLNAAYFYQHGSVTPMAVMGDFRADNALMDEEPYPEFDRYGPDLTVMEDQFFGPFYTALYKSILSANPQTSTFHCKLCFQYHPLITSGAAAWKGWRPSIQLSRNKLVKYVKPSKRPGAHSGRSLRLRLIDV